MTVTCSPTGNGIPGNGARVEARDLRGIGVLVGVGFGAVRVGVAVGALVGVGVGGT